MVDGKIEALDTPLNWRAIIMRHRWMKYSETGEEGSQVGEIS